MGDDPTALARAPKAGADADPSATDNDSTEDEVDKEVRELNNEPTPRKKSKQQKVAEDIAAKSGGNLSAHFTKVGKEQLLGKRPNPEPSQGDNSADSQNEATRGQAQRFRQDDSWISHKITGQNEVHSSARPQPRHVEASKQTQIGE